MENQEVSSTIEKFGKSLSRSVTLKLFSILILILLLLIPMSYVTSLISERQMLRQDAINDVTSTWSREQDVYGPILTIPLTKKVIIDDEVKVTRHLAHILPSALDISGNVDPVILNRGIYEIVVYNTQLSIKGSFRDLENYSEKLDEYTVHYEDAFLTVNISDTRGIKEEIALVWNGEKKFFDPGSSIPAIAPSGISVDGLLDPEKPLGKYDFSFNLKLQGSENIAFLPLGKETNIALASNWPDPKFDGAFLPDDREVTEAGFTAKWKILELNRNYPQFWVDRAYGGSLVESSFGVDLLIPANDYQKAMRSAKYALLAIALTFLTFFLVEIFNKKKMHPFQYIMVGLALTLFYTLLISISEHSSFNFAYLISSAVIILMIGGYSLAIFGTKMPTLVLVAILCFTYSFIFVTLQLQDYALMIGSIGLTSILAATMYLTRNINWYEISQPAKG